MIKNSDSLKAKVSNLARNYNISNKYIIQNILFEFLIERISKSKYNENFIIKGGFLLSSIFGVDLRSTMDLDTTLKGLPLNKKLLIKVINEIINIDLNDNVKFKLENIKEIRDEDVYSGFNVNLVVIIDKMKTNLMIDITTGDVITYKEVEFKYKTILDDKIIKIMTYNYETILAEKYETILRRNINNTRMKDYYDLFMFVKFKWNNLNKKILNDAILNTSLHRNSIDIINNANDYINLIKNDLSIKKSWNIYKNNYEYAKHIEFEDIIKCIEKIKDCN